MTTISKEQSPFTIGAIAFILIIGVSIAYYQFFYLPEINRKPAVPAEWRNPHEVVEIKILPNSYDPNQADNYSPKRVSVTLGQNNKVVWINDDSTAHTVTSSSKYVDPFSGAFDSLEHKDILKAGQGYLLPGDKFEFVFTKAGEYAYHCVPHPWMQGTIIVRKPTA